MAMTDDWAATGGSDAAGERRTSQVKMDDMGDMMLAVTRGLRSGEMVYFTNKRGEKIIVKGMDKWPRNEHTQACAKARVEEPFPAVEYELCGQGVSQGKRWQSCMERRVPPEPPKKGEDLQEYARREKHKKLPTAAELKAVHDLALHPPFAEGKRKINMAEWGGNRPA